MKKLILTITTGILLAACSSSVEDDLMTPGIPDEIMIEVDVDRPVSRAGYTNANLDKINLIIHNGVNPDYSYTASCSKIGMSWMTDKKMVWDPARSAVSVAAFAPARNVGSLSTIDVNVPAFYADANDVKNADFLLMTAEIDPKSDLTGDNKLQLTLSHTLSKLCIDFGDMVVSGVKVDGTVLTGKCNLRHENAAVEVTDNSSVSISPFKTDEGLYECMIIPQTAGKFSVSFRAGGRKYRWTSDKPVIFEPNTTYTLPLQATTSGSAKGIMEKGSRSQTY